MSSVFRPYGDPPPLLCFLASNCHTAHCILHTKNCTLCTAHYTLYTKLHTAHCILHIGYYTLHNAHCTLASNCQPRVSRLYFTPGPKLPRKSRQNLSINLGKSRSRPAEVGGGWLLDALRTAALPLRRKIRTIVLHQLQCTGGLL